MTKKKQPKETSEQSKPRLKHLRHFVPYLRKDYRELNKDELSNQETFTELFPNETYDPIKLRTIYEYQQLKK